MAPPTDCRILIIDPDPSIRALLTALLRRSGIETDSAGDHDTALQQLASAEYAAVILEPRMPRGDALLRAVHAAKQGEKPGIIIATTPDTVGTAAREVNGLVQAVLLKPFHLDELYATVAAQCQEQG
jgi:DNA-binding response OmpR family regulator